MLNAITKTFKKIIGNKAERDLKEVSPQVEAIKAIYPTLSELSNDELRAKTVDFKQQIQSYISDQLKQIEALKK